MYNDKYIAIASRHVASCIASSVMSSVTDIDDGFVVVLKRAVVLCAYMTVLVCVCVSVSVCVCVCMCICVCVCVPVVLYLWLCGMHESVIMYICVRYGISLPCHSFGTVWLVSGCLGCSNITPTGYCSKKVCEVSTLYPATLPDWM